MTATVPDAAFDAATFRRALGHVPTSVCVVTLTDDDGPTGMTVGSFTSISLDPPLVGFFADSASRTLGRIAAAGRFTVNLLRDDQQDVCGVFARRGGDRFADVELEPGPHETVRLAGAVGWIECDVDRVETIGDHDLVVGRVTELAFPAVPRHPLVFFRGTLCHLDGRSLPSSGQWWRDHYSDAW